MESGHMGVALFYLHKELAIISLDGSDYPRIKWLVNSSGVWGEEHQTNIRK